MRARTILLTLGTAFTLYLTLRGEVWTSRPAFPVALIIEDVLYVAVCLLALFVRSPGESAESADGESNAGISGTTRVPTWVAVLAFAAAVIDPVVTTLAAGPALHTEAVGTSYIGQIGALMTILMVRRRPIWAWVGMAALTVTSMISFGPLGALGLGLVGSLMWVAVAQLLISFFDRAVRDTVRLAELQRTATALQADQVGRQRQRRIQVQRALDVAGPVLTRTIETGGALSTAMRAEALRAEARLRDELRAPRLLDDHVRGALDAARRRGITVTLLDEGGLEGTDAGILASIRAQLAATIADATSDRLYVRTSSDPRIAVTVVGRSTPAGLLTDEDSVDLWREIHRDV